MGRPRKYEVVLTDEQRQELLVMLKQGAHQAREIRRAQTLLYSTDPSLSNTEIARLLHVSDRSVRQTQQRFVEQGLYDALYERPRSGRPREITKRDEAELTAIACSEPPPGRSRWTLRMIRDRYVALDEERRAEDGAPVEGELLRSISHEKVRQVLKKTF